MEQINKYIFYISIILNGVLLMVIAGVMPFLLYLSIIINLIFLWFTSKSLNSLYDIEEDMIYLMERNEVFLTDLEQIHGLEMYYGDENLQHLIDHSRELVNEFIDIQEKYFEVEITLEENEEEDEEEEGQIEEDKTPP